MYLINNEFTNYYSNLLPVIKSFNMYSEVAH